jgi:hypothetical protein
MFLLRIFQILLRNYQGILEFVFRAKYFFPNVLNRKPDILEKIKTDFSRGKGGHLGNARPNRGGKEVTDRIRQIDLRHLLTLVQFIVTAFVYSRQFLPV